MSALQRGVVVAEDVDEPGETVDRPQMRPQPAREEQRRDRKVLRARALGYGSHVHGYTFAQLGGNWSNAPAPEPP